MADIGKSRLERSTASRAPSAQGGVFVWGSAKQARHAVIDSEASAFAYPAMPVRRDGCRGVVGDVPQKPGGSQVTGIGREPLDRHGGREDHASNPGRASGLSHHRPASLPGDEWIGPYIRTWGIINMICLLASPDRPGYGISYVRDHQAGRPTAALGPTADPPWRPNDRQDRFSAG